MNDPAENAPSSVTVLEQKCVELGFDLSCDRKLGSLLRALAASKPGGSFLELWTGAGVSTAWLLDGMTTESTLISVELDPNLLSAAQAVLSGDSRLTLIEDDGGNLLTDLKDSRFDLIFADTWPGKYTHFDEAIALLKTGGLYVIDDMLPQPTWPEGHQSKVQDLLDWLDQETSLACVNFDWSTGVIVGTKLEG